MANTNVTTRTQMRALKEGDVFYVNGVEHHAESDAHPSGDASYEGYIVYGEFSNGFFEEDFPDI